jgi:uncharacterized protein YsxB (DUF464 family)
MTIVKVKKSGNSIVSVSCMGHTQAAERGEDIVCAALSSVVQTALLGLMQVAGINCKFTRDDEEGILLIKLPDILGAEERHDADVILNTMLCGVSDLAESFSKYIKLDVR